MNQIFALEYFDAIFRFLPTNKDLYSCLLVNKHWATCAVPILWEAPFRIKGTYIPSPKVIKTYLAFIPDNTFLRLKYERRIGLLITGSPCFKYPSFLKELSYDQFLKAAIANNCCKHIILELLRILCVRLRRFGTYSCLNHHSKNIYNIGSFILPHFSKYTYKFNGLTYLNCSYKWPRQKTQLFNAIAKNCHNIETLKVSIYYDHEGIALAALICSQKHLKKFSLINSNQFASLPVQALVSQKHSLNCVAFKDMHRDYFLGKGRFFKYSICRLNSNDINVLAQCTKIRKLKFKNCERLNYYVFLPFSTAFSYLTSLEYSYGTYNVHDRATPIMLLSDLIMTSCHTLKSIVLEWYSNNYIDITKLIKIITQYVISLEHLKIPLYTLDQLALIHQKQNQLKRLEIHIYKRISPYHVLFLLANVPLKSLEHSIQLYFDCYENFNPKFYQLNQIFESIFYK
ncbi:12706_t:CDS:1, partial [Cetraspora pellucida]